MLLTATVLEPAGNENHEVIDGATNNNDHADEFDGDSAQKDARSTKWKEHCDQDSGKFFYHHEESGETTWEKPSELTDNDAASTTQGNKWREHVSKSSRMPFWHDEETGETTWDKPSELSNADAVPSSEPQAAGRETKWKEHFDEASGAPFYHHEETGETSWEKPAELSGEAPPKFGGGLEEI